MERMSIFLTETIPLANFVTTKYPWNKTSTTTEMTGIPADVLLMAEMEDMKFIISDLKSSLETSFKTILYSEIDAREVGVPCMPSQKILLQS